MPARAGAIWILTALVLLAFPILNFVYWPRLLYSGALPADSDSIGIPMFGSILITLIASPVFLGVALLCSWRCHPQIRLPAPWTVRTVLRITAALILGVGGIAACLSALLEASNDMPWYEYLWPAYMILMGAWMLVISASLIGQRSGADL